jgi:hypothetical protein
MKVYVLIVLVLLATCPESLAGNDETKSTRQKRILEFQDVGQKILRSHAEEKKESITENVLNDIKKVYHSLKSNNNYDAVADFSKLQYMVQCLIEKLEKQSGDNSKVSDSQKVVLNKLNSIDNELSKLLSKKEKVEADDMLPLLNQVKTTKKQFSGHGNGNNNWIIEEHH